MSTFLSLSDDDIELLNRQFGLKLTREEWNRRLTTTPTFASLVRSYFDWHISNSRRSPGDDRLPAGINAIDAPFRHRTGASEPDARLRAARFMLETIRPIPEDGEAREKRISLLTEPLHSGALPDAAFVRRVLYLAGRWYHRPDQMDAEGALMLRKYLLRVWPEYAGEPVTTKLIRLWRTSEYVIGTVTVNSTLN
ncbi:MAG: hypothetical protein ACLTS9_07575 [Sutterella wadsworthensis]